MTGTDGASIMTPDREKLVLEALRPCPFCGGGAHIQQDDTADNVITVRCGECMFNYQRYHRTRMDQAIAAWNRRAPLAETAPSGEAKAGGKHRSHVTRPSDASTFDEKCIHCGATDEAGNGWGKLAEPCPVMGAAIEKEALRALATIRPTPSASEDRAGEDRLREIRGELEDAKRRYVSSWGALPKEWVTVAYLLSALSARDETIARLTREREVRETRQLTPVERRLVEAETDAQVNKEFMEEATRQRDAALAKISALEARLAVMGEALRLAGDWLSCVEPHLRDSADFKRHRETIRAALTDGERDGD